LHQVFPVTTDSQIKVLPSSILGKNGVTYSGNADHYFESTILLVVIIFTTATIFRVYAHRRHHLHDHDHDICVYVIVIIFTVAITISVFTLFIVVIIFTITTILPVVITISDSRSSSRRPGETRYF